SRESAFQVVNASTRRLAALDVLAQRVEKTRDCDDDRDALTLNRVDDLRGVERILEEDFAAQKLRHQKAHELSEDVAERQKAEEAYGVYETLPAQVLLNLLFERREVGEKISVREADAAWLCGRARSVNDLDEVAVGNFPRLESLG